MDRYCIVKLSIIYTYLYVEVGHDVTCISYYGSQTNKRWRNHCCRLSTVYCLKISLLLIAVEQ